jgi:integrase
MKSKLTVRQIESAKPGHPPRALRNAQPGKPYRLTDGGGLSLRVMPTGAKYWQYRYRIGGRETTMQLGSYPAMGLEAARKEHQRQRAILGEGSSPITERRISKARVMASQAETFGAVAAEWLDYHRPAWSEVHHERNAGLLRRVLYPKLEKLPLSGIDATALLQALKAAEGAGIAESARRARAIAAQIFDYAIGSGRATVNPARDLAKALRKPEVRHFAALPVEQVGDFLRVLRASGTEPVTKAALRLMLLTGLRDYSLRGARWSEIDFAAGRWTVPAERMKRGEPHTVPLPHQAIAALRDLAPLTDRGPDSFIFAGGGKAGHLAENTLRIALHRLGFKVTAHGFRSLLTDQLYLAGFRGEWVERQMHHRDKNQVRAAYLRTDFIEQRATMMQWWADFCDAREGNQSTPELPANVIPLRAA